MVTFILLFIKSILYLCIGIFLFVIPGWSLLDLFWKGWQNKIFFEKAGLASGLSLAIYPLLFLWLGLFHIKFGIFMSILPGLVGTTYLLTKLVKKLRLRLLENSLKTSQQDKEGLSKSTCLDKKDYFRLLLNQSYPFLLSLLVILLVIFSRLNNLRFVNIPMWGDSLQHTVIAQLFYDNHGMFETWFPYAPYVSFTVQYGFSALTTILMWISQLSSPSSTLLVGQFVNILAVISIFPLSYKLSGKNSLAAIFSVVVAGLLSPLPGGYINWGRYAQLTGLAILPAALYLTQDLIEDLIKPDLNQHYGFNVIRPYLGKIALISMILIGMMLSYYRLFLFYGTFVFSLFVVIGLLQRKITRSNFIHIIVTISIIGFTSIILFLPWLINVQGGSLANKVETGVTGQMPTLNYILSEYQVWRDILVYVPVGLVIIFILGLVWGIIRKQWSILGIGLWTLLLSSLVLLKVLRIPTAYFAQNFAVIISLFIPISVVSGWLLAELLHKIIQLPKNFNTLKIILLFAFTVIIILGVIQQSRIADPDFYALVTSGDLKAINYIRNNIPERSLFLVEAMTIPPGDSIIGNDAGWWLPLLANRANLVPPQYAHLNETPAKPDYNQRIVNLVKIIQEKPLPSQESIQILCDEGITHVYIGQKEGKVSYGNNPLFTADQLDQSALFIPLYKRDRVRIYQFDRSNCDLR